MTSFTLNIHEFYSDLKEAGFTEKQADVIAKIQGKAASATIEQVKSDLHLDEIATKRDTDRLDGRLNLVQWMIGFNLAFTMAVLWKVFS